MEPTYEELLTTVAELEEKLESAESWERYWQTEYYKLRDSKDTQ